jgi:26S proteasome regulatory subunit N10
MILNSPVLASDRGIPDELAATVPGGLPGAAGAAGTSQFEFGVDPSLDPELAMVAFLSPPFISFQLIFTLS